MQFNIWYWVAASLALMLFQSLFMASTQVALIPYSQFETYLGEGKIAEVAVSDRFIQGRFKVPIDDSRSVGHLRPETSTRALSRGHAGFVRTSRTSSPARRPRQGR
jgi:cell division protease FtsH